MFYKGIVYSEENNIIIACASCLAIEKELGMGLGNEANTNSRYIRDFAALTLTEQQLCTCSFISSAQPTKNKPLLFVVCYPEVRCTPVFPGEV